MTMVLLDHVKLTLPENKKNILEDIHYTINENDFVILLGSNGSGKSSLLKLFYQQFTPSAGTIHLMGKPLQTQSSKSIHQQISVLTQNTSDTLFSSLTLYENYLLIRKGKPKKRTHLAEYLKPYNPNLAEKLDTLIANLSGGEKQALALAFCLLHPPAILLLDEHTSALDPKTSQQIMQLTKKMIEKHGITCILTTHDLDIALTYGNRILMLKEGKMHKTFESTEKNALNKEMLFSAYQ